MKTRLNISENIFAIIFNRNWVSLATSWGCGGWVEQTTTHFDLATVATDIFPHRAFLEHVSECLFESSISFSLFLFVSLSGCACFWNVLCDHISLFLSLSLFLMSWTMMRFQCDHRSNFFLSFFVYSKREYTPESVSVSQSPKRGNILWLSIASPRGILPRFV